ncbi:hypothetical protein LOC68_22005 [Blastopirellula sp. JC732]|uniref:Uncharacterized protein n=1 Tax=Blastopirellula sediminis TaxID=2894196 RepID=A0A9X1SHD2_9BACT|nr:hypothetical protein [Blastopirellula sediminis]MCC9605625.1 hypothetical protein [Blastopirellula sediminis]MCC9631075.1 hypothetical protein [Blastopirellula sediminis]
MSYNVGLLIEAAPVDHDEAMRYFHELYEHSEFGQPHSTFVEMHDELTTPFPCLCAMPDDDIDDRVWSDGPLINNFGSRTAVIGISYSRADEVLPVVLRLASRLGVTVFDWQTNLIHRPGET